VLFLLCASKGGAMLNQITPGELLATTPTDLNYLCLHGHFYQPPRVEPFSHVLPLEPGATPFANYNEKITAECYQPNAEAGNFEYISFDFGPTLAAWLEQTHPDIHRTIVEAEHKHFQRYGVSNAMAQVYNHTILPLATSNDKRTQVAWGLQDYRHRFGHEAHGMWLAETAVDLETLDILAQQGVTYTVLAPWQATTTIDPTEPYLVSLPEGRSITVFFYNAPLSGGVSFDWNTTNDANVFAASYLPYHLLQSKVKASTPQLVLIATDGELYGHHKPWRDKFLAHLVRHGAPSYGFEVCSLEHYMQMFPATKKVELRTPSAWSCSHGVHRWSAGCECTEGDSSWKNTLRTALTRLSAKGDLIFEQYTSKTLENPWKARDEYITLRNGWESQESFWNRHSREHLQPTSQQQIYTTELLLEAQFYLQYSFTSCGFFFEDLDRIEPRNNIAFARKAISLIWQALDIDLQQDFLNDLRLTRSWRNQKTGAEMYRELPVVAKGLLPPL
jgi:alpha-amylase/alpha-mannosidase (GH57 family)